MKCLQHVIFLSLTVMWTFNAGFLKSKLLQRDLHKKVPVFCNVTMCSLVHVLTFRCLNYLGGFNCLVNEDSWFLLSICTLLSNYKASHYKKQLKWTCSAHIKRVSFQTAILTPISFLVFQVDSCRQTPTWKFWL